MKYILTFEQFTITSFKSLFWTNYLLKNSISSCSIKQLFLIIFILLFWTGFFIEIQTIFISKQKFCELMRKWYFIPCHRMFTTFRFRSARWWVRTRARPIFFGKINSQVLAPNNKLIRSVNINSHRKLSEGHFSFASFQLTISIEIASFKGSVF